MKARALLLLALAAIGCLAVVALLRVAGRDDALADVPTDRTARARAEGWLGELDAATGRVVHPGPLSDSHAHLEGLSACDLCHGDRDDVPDARCLACHQEIGARARERMPLHGTFEGDCRVCHPEHGGEERPLLILDREGLQHGQTRFPLRGAHLDADCDACHQLAIEDGSSAFRFQGVPHRECVPCHRDPHAGGDRRRPRTALRREELDAIRDPVVRVADPEHPITGRDCSSCHGEASFEAAALIDGGFSHDRHTRFALEGVHTGVGCRACHSAEQRALEIEQGLAPGTAAGPSCGECHDDPHRGALTRAQECARCHEPTRWSASFDHQTDTRFELDELHAELACGRCHEDSRYRASGIRCSDCHGDAASLLAGDFVDGSSDPDPHAQDVQCLDCHGSSRAGNGLAAIARRCTSCHDPTYAQLAATWRSALDEGAIEAARRSSDPLIEKLRRSGPHNPELASRLLGSIASHPPQP